MSIFPWILKIRRKFLSYYPGIMKVNISKQTINNSQQAIVSHIIMYAILIFLTQHSHGLNCLS